METATRNWLALPVLALAASLAHADTYAIDPDHTRATFEINHFGYSTFRGRFDRTSGTIAYDAKARTGSAKVTVEVASVSTGVPKLDQHLLSADFFDAARHPTLTFESTAFVFDGERLESVEGNVTIRGVTRPISLKVNAVSCKPHPLRKTPACGADAEAKLKRSDFGVSAYVPAVADEVTLKISVETQ